MIKVICFSLLILVVWGCSDMGDKVASLSPDNPDTLISFSADIQPIFNANCAGCHIGGASSGDLRLDNYTLLMSTGIHAPVIVANQPDSSYLVKKIEGTAGDRMPLGGFLSSSDSLIIRDWIRQGAMDN
jgi:hypothetical protein